MSTSIVICEKPSQARAVRAAVGDRYGQVLPARGHILTLEPPEAVREDWARWSTDLLWPGRFYAKRPVKGTESLLSDIARAARGASRIVIATDCDREGQLIGEEIVEHIGFRGEVLRAVFNAEDPVSLRRAFEALRPNRDFAGLYAAGRAREQADQVINLSLTRAATVRLRAPGAKGAIGIGRVKTPVLGILCRREAEIRDFRPTDLFEVDADVRLAGGLATLTCARLPETLADAAEEASEDDEDAVDPEGEEAALAARDPLHGRIRDRAMAEGLAAAARGAARPVTCAIERRREGPPPLFDLTGLQTAASALFGWTAARTLEVAQELYAEWTLITYPRADARHLPEEAIKDVPALSRALLGLAGYAVHAPLLAEPQVRRGARGHYSDAALAGQSHHAIVPNVNMAAEFAATVPRLPSDPARLFDLIARRWLAALAPDHEFRAVSLSMTVPWKGHDWRFSASGRTPLVPGWRAILGGGAEDGAAEFPPVKPGEVGRIEETRLRTVVTRPPARYTEGALIRVMKEAWRLVEDPVRRARLKAAKGIGTPATRGEVIKGLVAQDQVRRVRKTLQPTEDGMKLWELLLRIAPNTVDPGRTAAWEMAFDLVEQGRLGAEEAVLKLIEDARRDLERIAAVAAPAIGRSAPTPRMIAAAKAAAARTGAALPKEALDDATACRAFLEAHPAPEAGGERAGGPRGTGERQLAFARDLAARLGREIPAAALASGKALSDWIDAAKAEAPPRPPSAAQVAFAEKLAAERGEPVPDAARADGRACSAWIDARLSGRRGGGSGERRGGPAAPRPRPRAAGGRS